MTGRGREEGQVWQLWLASDRHGHPGQLATSSAVCRKVTLSSTASRTLHHCQTLIADVLNLTLDPECPSGRYLLTALRFI